VCIVKYFIAFILKHPLLNPIIARHERVNRFSRGLIHYTGLSAMLLIIVCWLNGVQWADTRWRSALFCLFINFIFGRIWNFVMYNLHAQDTIRLLWIVVTVFNFLLFVGCWIFIHFAASWLEWSAFKNIWWLAPMSLVVEFLWEVIIDIPHVLIADHLNRDRRNCTKWRGKDTPERRKLIERCVANNIILTYLAGY